MPGENIQDWSTTAATNATADTSINWAEGQPRASVNNSARSMMAAHAKDRNLKNGSITTGGTANAQTFTSGVTYTTVPTGLWVRLKVGFTNTGATTLNMDGIGAVTVLDQTSNNVAAGAFTTGQYVELIYNGTNWILLRQSAAGAAPQCGRLDFVASTTLSFKPYNGDQIKIDGLFYSIPAAGIAGLANTGAFVNGAGGQSLAGNTLYYVYAFNNAGVVTADFSPTTHAMSSTAGNIGTEIKGGDNTRTLIGMVRTDNATPGTFRSDVIYRGVVSWLNRRNLSLTGPTTAGAATASTTAIEVNSGARANFITWGEDAVDVGMHGFMFCSVVQSLNASVYLDSTTSIISVQGHSSSANFQLPIGGMAGTAPAEGFHYLAPFGLVGGGTGTYYFVVTGMIRG